MFQAERDLTLERCILRSTGPAEMSRFAVAEGRKATVVGCLFEGFETALDVEANPGMTVALRDSIFLAARPRRADRPGPPRPLDLRPGGREPALGRALLVPIGVFLEASNFGPSTPLDVEVSGSAFLVKSVLGVNAEAKAPLGASAAVRWKGRDNRYQVAGPAWASFPDAPTSLDAWSKLADEADARVQPLKLAKTPPDARLARGFRPARRRGEGRRCTRPRTSGRDDPTDPTRPDGTEDAMSISTLAEVEYPDDDGEPMSDNTLQFEWIVTIKGGLDALFRDDPDVFVAGDLLWYPVQGDNKTRLAPDAMVAFGRPKGYRGSYMQWVEGGIAAPGRLRGPLAREHPARHEGQKRAWYFRYGVEEYYEFDPDRLRLRGWIKEGETAREIVPMSGWVSPRLGIRFELGEDLTIVRPDGRPFETFVEISRERDRVEGPRRGRTARTRRRTRAEEARRPQSEARSQRGANARPRRQANAQAEEERRQGRPRGQIGRVAEKERQRAERLAAKLRAAGLEPDE